MRRKDREMGEEFALQVIDKARFGVMSLVDDREAYGIPLSIARIGKKLYFHSAKAGKKVDLIPKNPKVHISFVGEHHVPTVFDKNAVEEMTSEPEKFAQLTSKIFTTEFESAMVLGFIQKLENDDEKIKGLRAICEKFTPQWMAYFDKAIASGLKVTDVYVIDIEELTAKRKKFDAFGEEMKWQRMEESKEK